MSAGFSIRSITEHFAFLIKIMVIMSDVTMYDIDAVIPAPTILYKGININQQTIVMIRPASIAMVLI